MLFTPKPPYPTTPPATALRGFLLVISTVLFHYSAAVVCHLRMVHFCIKSVKIMFKMVECYSTL